VPQGTWSSATRELAVTAGLAAALTATAWVLLGPAGAAATLAACAALSMVILRWLLPQFPPDESEPASYPDLPATTFAGFWRTQTDLSDAIASMSAWDLTTRRRMQNLLAARLSERHGVSLADDPEQARAIFLGDGTRADLWYWIDPSRPTPPDAMSRSGIPPRALSALIHRLEKL
jgi:hypothetical protein